MYTVGTVLSFQPCYDYALIDHRAICNVRPPMSEESGRKKRVGKLLRWLVGCGCPVECSLFANHAAVFTTNGILVPVRVRTR